MLRDPEAFVSPPKPVALIIALGQSFTGEPRVRAQVLGLSRRFRVHGFGAAGSDVLEAFTQVPPPPRVFHRLIKMAGSAFPGLRITWEAFFHRGLARRARELRPDLVIANNLLSAWVARGSGLPFVLDSQEYLPRQFDGSRSWRAIEMRYRRRALKMLFPLVSFVTLEGEAVAGAYAKEYPVVRGKTRVVPNMPPLTEGLKPSPVSGKPFRLIHHGTLVPERGLELLIEVVAELGANYELTFMGGCTDPGYLADLKLAGERAGNVFFRDPVAYEDIVRALNAYDLGLVFFGSPHFHHRFMTVPNKFWECLHARVPVVVSAESAMADYVRRTGFGVVAESGTKDGFVRAISGLSAADLEAMKHNLDEKAFSHSQNSWIEGYADALTAQNGQKIMPMAP